MIESIASRVQRRFSMTEEEYLLDRIKQGWTAGGISTELGVSRQAVVTRLRRIARPSKPWMPKRTAA